MFITCTSTHLQAEKEIRGGFLSDGGERPIGKDQFIRLDRINGQAKLVRLPRITWDSSQSGALPKVESTDLHRE